jgi:type IV pilus assembly protein PilX
MKHRSGLAARHQGGAVLIIGLLLLLVLVLLAVAGSQSSVIQVKLSGNFRDLNRAFESAEAGNRWPSAWLLSRGRTALSRPFPCVDQCDQTSPVWQQGIYPSSPGPKDAIWASARAFGTDPTDDSDTAARIPDVRTQPKFIIEQQQFLRDDLAGNAHKGVAFYRVTTASEGSRADSTAVVRAVVAKRFE